MATSIGKMPILTELAPPPCDRWSVDYCDGTPARVVTMSVDHALCGEIFSCSCGAIYSWSPGVEVGKECPHILVVTLALLHQLGIL
jgi:hypothetical protein